MLEDWEAIGSLRAEEWHAIVHAFKVWVKNKQATNKAKEEQGCRWESEGNQEGSENHFLRTFWR